MLFHYYFFVGSIGGFLLELFYRRIKFKKWIKPGVFKGCYLPLYGIGLVVCYLCYLFKANLIIKLLLAGFLLTCIELICGLIFIKTFRLPLWDYSKEFFNYKGLICMKFSFIWLFLGGVSFIWFEYIGLSFFKLIDIIILVFEVILGIDVFVFFIKESLKKKKKNFHLDL